MVVLHYYLSSIYFIVAGVGREKNETSTPLIAGRLYVLKQLFTTCKPINHLDDVGRDGVRMYNFIIYVYCCARARSSCHKSYCRAVFRRDTLNVYTHWWRRARAQRDGRTENREETTRRRNLRGYENSRGRYIWQTKWISSVRDSKPVRRRGDEHITQRPNSLSRVRVSFYTNYIYIIDV